MRVLILAVASLGLVGATDKAAFTQLAPSPTLGLDNPAYQDPVRPWTRLPVETRAGSECADQIRRAQSEVGSPVVNKGPVESNDAMLIWAVDHRREGCGVLVPLGRPDDVRPVPRNDGSLEIILAGD